MTRAAFIRTLIHEPPDRGQIATAEEVLLLSSEQARAGKVAAMIALERALRNAPPELDDELDRILRSE